MHQHTCQHTYASDQCSTLAPRSHRRAQNMQMTGLYGITVYGDFVIANRASYEYDFRGPSTKIRTGCSSAIIGLYEACRALYSGDCSSAVVGGTNLILSPTMSIAMTEHGALSPTGSCRTSTPARTATRREAIIALYIKNLDDVIRDGNPVRAVIRATSTNCDEKTSGISNTSSESHEAMMRSPYQMAHLDDFSQTAFVDCHGTDTATGDPLEAHAVANVFGDSGI